MATVRSISPTKPPERLLNRRLTRSSTLSTPPSQRKTTPIAVATIKRRKSSRMSSKKKSAAVHLNSITTITTIPDNNDLTNKMASTTINELPPISKTSRISDTNSITSNISIPQIQSDTILNNKQFEESHNENPITNNMNETLSSPSLSRKSFSENIEFTVESFDTIRTVGTGKIFKF
jgi:hypothetical protein